MIKVIAFDLVGVLVRERDINLSEHLSKMERLFGPNISDKEYIDSVKCILPKMSEKSIVEDTKRIINMLYTPKVNIEEMIKLKEELNDVSFVVATNHVSFVKEYFLRTFGESLFSNIYISANINEIKPEKEFYTKLLEDLKIKPEELLFVDDNEDNVNGAKSLGIQAIHISKEDNVILKIKEYIKASK